MEDSCATQDWWGTPIPGSKLYRCHCAECEAPMRDTRENLWLDPEGTIPRPHLCEDCASDETEELTTKQARAAGLSIQPLASECFE